VAGGRAEDEDGQHAEGRPVPGGGAGTGAGCGGRGGLGAHHGTTPVGITPVMTSTRRARPMIVAAQSSLTAKRVSFAVGDSSVDMRVPFCGSRRGGWGKPTTRACAGSGEVGEVSGPGMAPGVVNCDPGRLGCRP